MSKRVRRALRRFSTALHVAGLKQARPFGFHIPYRYAAAVRPASEDEGLPWLEQRLRDEAGEYLGRVRSATQFNDRFGDFHAEHAQDRNRPRFNQQWFAGLDAAMAYALVRCEPARRIVEVGSGHSTRFLRQAITDSGSETHLRSIDPQPRRDIDEICDEVTRAQVESLDPQVFTALHRGDILFIDASHIAMPGTDVDFLFTQVLPVLQPGVRVHIHDVFLPYGYPGIWTGRGYNEQLMVAAILTGGSRFKILCPNAWLRRCHADAVSELNAPLTPGAHESSLWLEVR